MNFTCALFGSLYPSFVPTFCQSLHVSGIVAQPQTLLIGAMLTMTAHSGSKASHAHAVLQLIAKLLMRSAAIAFKMSALMAYGYNQSLILMTAAAAYIVQLVVAEFAHIRGLVFLKLIEVGICFLIGNIPVLLNGHFP